MLPGAEWSCSSQDKTPMASSTWWPSTLPQNFGLSWKNLRQLSLYFFLSLLPLIFLTLNAQIYKYILLPFLSLLVSDLLSVFCGEVCTIPPFTLRMCLSFSSWFSSHAGTNSNLIESQDISPPFTFPKRKCIFSASLVYPIHFWLHPLYGALTMYKQKLAKPPK